MALVQRIDTLEAIAKKQQSDQAEVETKLKALQLKSSHHETKIEELNSTIEDIARAPEPEPEPEQKRKQPSAKRTADHRSTNLNVS